MGAEVARHLGQTATMEAASFDYATYQPDNEAETPQTPDELIRSIRYYYRSTISPEIADVLRAFRPWYATRAINEMTLENADDDKQLELKKEEDTATESLNKTLGSLLTSRRPGLVSMTIRNVRRLEQAFASQTPDQRGFRSPISATADALTSILAIPLNPPAGRIAAIGGR